ncbi:MAG TPA: hypothetical protein VFR24_28175, partial [Candidatus Angelobacter sp.]|nr:hypothetical protein [Candidatus Angelobacter sp.]
LLKTGMIITTYNVHLKAPFFPVVFVVKQRILCRTGPSLLFNQSFAASISVRPCNLAAPQRVGSTTHPLFSESTCLRLLENSALSKAMQ